MSYKSSTGRNIGKLLNVFQSGKTILGQQIGGGGSAAAVFSATGGTLVQSGGYNYHVFTQPDIFSVTNTTGVGVTATILLVGGGGSYGGGPGSNGGGGGAGGVYEIEHSMSVTVDTPVSIGSAGGNPTSFGNHIAFGGGSGGTFVLGSGPAPAAALVAINGNPGGSGGGSSTYFTPGGPQAVGAVGVATSMTTFPKVMSGLGTVTFSQGSPGKAYGSPPGGGGGLGGGSSNTGPAAAPFSNFPGPIISPAIPAPVRPSWNPIVGPTGLYGAGSGSSVDFTGNGGWVPNGAGGSGIVIIRYLTP